MSRQHIHTLAREMGFESEEQYYDYIIDSLVNGQRQQVRELFNVMHSDDKAYFLIHHLDVSIGYHKSVLNICIIELTR